MTSLSIGSRGSAVSSLQQALNDAGYDIGNADGVFGQKTADAVRRYQADNGLQVDGKVGAKTAAALGLSDSFDSGDVDDVKRPDDGDGFDGGDMVARLDRQPSGAGMTSGTITLNGRTYRFNSGSGSLYSTPRGSYVVKSHGYDSSRGGAYSRNGVGFSFLIEDENREGSDAMYDSRKGVDRTALRIHPDGGDTGTAGCIGLTGSASELRQFQQDIRDALRSNGGSIRLTVS